MKRREFIKAAGVSILGFPLTAQAQQPAKLPVIGFLGANTLAAQSRSTEALIQRLRELGWNEGRNIAIEYRWAEGSSERSPKLMAEFVELPVDVIVTHAPLNVIAAKRATSTIPIVFAAVGDPVGIGVVASLSRPGGNVTGLSLQSAELAGKRLEILREIIPGLRRVVVLTNADSPNAALEIREIQSAAQTLGLDVVFEKIWRAEDIASALAVPKAGTDALYVQTDPIFNTHRSRITALALDARVPTISGTREYVEAGSLISYGANLTDLFRRTGDIVDKILRGAKPSDLPVQQPTKFDLILNLKTARTLGLDLSASLIARAEEVVE
ncbi:ABC transporter substrate-binding protein [Bradyrhizobium sp. LjRoot220]|uniref:ABC transporter substrate-binding protein n=1 Tax=Bradyrhizobium sp. LjRoot220 TaxID=3342284 RepID=UPI003ECEB969